MYTKDATLNEVLSILGYTKERSRHARFTIISPEGERFEGHTAHTTWDLLRQRHPKFFEASSTV